MQFEINKFFAKQISFEWLITSMVFSTGFIWLLYILNLVFNLPVGHWWQYLALPGEFFNLLRQPWSIITYAWVHTELVGFLINLLMLYFIGRLFLIYEKEKKLLRLFFAGILSGALSFLLSYYFLPFLYSDERQAYLTGISGGFVIWLAYLAAKYPDYEVHISVFGNWKIKYLFFFLLFFDLVLLNYSNSGGHVAHLGAMATGWIFGKTGIKKSIGSISTKNKIYDNYKTANEKKIDRILEKINRSGYESLTEKEKEILYRESQRNRD